MKIKLIRKGGLHWMRSNYEEKTRTITVYNSGKNTSNLFLTLSHELGHHNFQMEYEKMSMWRKIISKLINEHELKACIQEGKEVTVEVQER